jgi:hypothetical protein
LFLLPNHLLPGNLPQDILSWSGDKGHCLGNIGSVCGDIGSGHGDERKSKSTNESLCNKIVAQKICNFSWGRVVFSH